MAINPMALMKMKERLKQFNADHPKVAPFFRVLHNEAIKEGSILELKVTTPEGKDYVSNIRLNANDIETLRMLIK